MPPGSRLPPIIVRIIFLALSKSLSSELTSAVVTPDPLAIRRRRDPEMIPGSCARPGHGQDHRLSTFQLAFIDRVGHLLHRVLPAGHARQHLREVAHRAELLHLPELIEEVFERELPFHHVLGGLLRLLDVELLLRLVDQGQDVAHAEDATGHAVGEERLEVVGLLPRADEVDRAAGDGRDRERGAATRRRRAS